MLQLSGVFFLYHLFLFCAFSVNSSCSDLPSLISMSSTQFWLLLSVLHPRSIPVVIKARVTVKLILFSIFQSSPCFTALYPMCWIQDSCFIFLPSFLFVSSGRENLICSSILFRSQIPGKHFFPDKLPSRTNYLLLRALTSSNSSVSNWQLWTATPGLLSYCRVSKKSKYSFSKSFLIFIFIYLNSRSY